MESGCITAAFHDDADIYSFNVMLWKIAAGLNIKME